MLCEDCERIEATAECAWSCPQCGTYRARYCRICYKAHALFYQPTRCPACSTEAVVSEPMAV